MTKTNQAWNTRDDLIPSLPRGVSKKQLSKVQERDENTANMMTHLDLLTKHVMGEICKNVNVIGYSGGVAFDDVPYDIAYNEEIYYL